MTRERLPVTTCPYCYARRTARTLPYHLNVCAQARAEGERVALPCEVCGRVAAPGRVHPCRFEKGCACWYGVPCEPVGARYTPAGWRITSRRTA